jgi:carbon storage regulator CsrA
MALVISRKRGETVEIGDGILIEIVDTRSDKVRLAITAPKEVIVHRGEVAARIARAAPGSVPGDAGTTNRQGAILP